MKDVGRLFHPHDRICVGQVGQVNSAMLIEAELHISTASWSYGPSGSKQGKSRAEEEGKSGKGRWPLERKAGRSWRGLSRRGLRGVCLGTEVFVVSVSSDPNGDGVSSTAVFQRTESRAYRTQHRARETVGKAEPLAAATAAARSAWTRASRIAGHRSGVRRTRPSVRTRAEAAIQERRA